jgi:hypothetical protein
MPAIGLVAHDIALVWLGKVNSHGMIHANSLPICPYGIVDMDFHLKKKKKKKP